MKKVSLKAFFQSKACRKGKYKIPARRDNTRTVWAVSSIRDVFDTSAYSEIFVYLFPTSIC